MAQAPRWNGPFAWAAGPERLPSGELVGVVLPVFAPVRRPLLAPRIDIEIHGRSPDARAEVALATAAELMQGVDALRDSAESIAPEEWKRNVRDSPNYPGLVLDGFEFHDDGLVYVFFDYDGMESLGLALQADGHRYVFFA